MFFYIMVLVVLSVLLVTSWFFNSNTPIFFMGMIMALIAGFRVNTGFDYESYQLVYNQIASGTSATSVTPQFERGYMLLNWVAVKIGMSFNEFVLFFSVITIGLLTIFLIKLNNPEIASMAMYYYFARFYFTRDLGQIRSSLAAVLCLFAIKLILSKKKYTSIVVILLAACFQKVAFILFLAILAIRFIKIKINLVTFTTLIIVSIAVSKIIGNFLTNHAELFGEYSTYITSEYFTTGTGLNNPVIWMQVLVEFVAVLFFFQLSKGFEEKELTNKDIFKLSNIQYLIMIYLIGTLILILLNQLPTAAGRTSTVLNTVEILIVPFIIKRLIPRALQLLVFIPFAITIWYVFLLHAGLENFVPYLTFLGA